MSRPREIELKLELAPDQAKALERSRLLRNSRQATPKILRAIYFDDKKRKLRQQGWSLRLRTSVNGKVQTVKHQAAASVGFFPREEWESEIDGITPDLKAVKRTPLGSMMTKKLGRKLFLSLRRKCDERALRFVAATTKSRSQSTKEK